MNVLPLVVTAVVASVVREKTRVEIDVSLANLVLAGCILSLVQSQSEDGNK